MAPKKGTSYYKTVKGVKYDRGLLEKAEAAVKKGKVSLADAKALWADAMDGPGVTKIERRTLEHVVAEFQMADDATKYLKKELTGGSSNKQYYKSINGVKYDKELYEHAEDVVAKSGTISLSDAKELWELALDGKGVTPTEKKTLEFIVDTMKITKPAADHLKKEMGIATEAPEPPAAEEAAKEAAAEPAAPAAPAAGDDDLPDFDEDEPAGERAKADDAGATEAKKGTATAIHASGFRDFLLKPELLRAIVDCGFEHPSEVQHECIPQAILGTDILCQAKSGMGKTAVFVLACLQQLDVSTPGIKVLVLCHTRELAYQIKTEFDRFAQYLADVKTAVVYGGTPIANDKEMLRDSPPSILMGTPGRILGLLRDKDLKLDKVAHFVLDECDKCLDKLDMRSDIQRIFVETPKKKHVMMFSATMTTETRSVCKKFMHNPHEISIDDESKLTLHGLVQYYVNIQEREKNRRLNDLLDALEFNQVVIFVKSVQRAIALDKLLVECNFPSVAIHSGLGQADRIERYTQFKKFNKRIMVSTDLFGRGIDIERVNIVINYDMPSDSDSYLHRVGRAGRFGTKGLAITFVTSEEDEKVLKAVQDRFEVAIGAMPSQIDTSSYT